jgi:hypothetical protein
VLPDDAPEPAIAAPGGLAFLKAGRKN